MEGNGELVYNVNFAEMNDLEGIAELYTEWRKFKGILPDIMAEPETAQDLMSYFNGSNKARRYIVAKREGVVIGVCYADVTYLGFSSVRLGDMIVSEPFRRKGVGTALVKKLTAFVASNDVKKIWLWTQEELEPALNFYKKLGFAMEGRQKKQFCNKDALLFGMVLN